MAYSKEREAIWSDFLTREKDHYETRAQLSLIKRGIKNPSSLHLRLEILFHLHKNLDSDSFLGDLSDHELGCILLTAWGLEAKEIGYVLGIKEDSIHKFRARVSRKLNTKNIPNTVYRASQAGILSVNNIDFLLCLKKENSIQRINQTYETKNTLT
jgi:DNA-binding NarL/FixJ family response regulator